MANQMKKMMTLMVVMLVVIGMFDLHTMMADGKKVEDRKNQLLTLSKENPLIQLDSNGYSRFIRGSNRDYSIILMLTAMAAHHKCQPCRHVYNEFEIVAKSWKMSEKHDDSVFFAVVDYDTGVEVFKNLNLQTAPVIMHFPAIGQRKDADTFIFNKQISASSILRFVKDRTHVDFDIYHEPDYVGNFFIVVILVLIGTIVWTFFPKIYEIASNSKMWICVVMLTILYFSSGQMWNHIRGPPYNYKDPNTGRSITFHRDSNSQFIGETHLVLMLYLIISSLVIGLNMVPQLVNDVYRSKVAGLLLALFVIFASVLVRIFANKQRGYPYKLLF